SATAVAASCVRTLRREADRWIVGSGSLARTTTASSTKGTVSAYVARGDNSDATTPPARALTVNAALPHICSRPYTCSNRSLSTPSSTRTSYTIASTVPELSAEVGAQHHRAHEVAADAVAQRADRD